jgi:spore maturation protein CgeB
MKKLLHVMMGKSNVDLQRALNLEFNCIHFDWTTYQSKSSLLQTNLLNEFNCFKPDFVFMHLQSGEVLDISTIEYMANNSIVVNWTGDVRYPLPTHYLQIGKIIHSTLFTNMNDVETCLQNGVKADYLQVGYDSTNFTPYGETNIKYQPILFLGSNYSNIINFPLTNYRNEMVKLLKNRFGNYFGLYGNFWNGFADGNINNYYEEGKAYRSSKIAINLSHFEYKRYSSDRLYRILGSGAFCLTHYYPEIEKDFTDGKDLVVWKNFNDLIDKINYYLINEEERKIIANNGYNKAINNYTWDNFAQNLKKIIYE